MLNSVFARSHKILITSSTNPYINLAKELELLYYPKNEEKILYLWRNEPVVVIGKHQNPYKECNLGFMRDNNIKLARRPTGGGAVYQDLGNTCWTFVAPQLEPSKNTQIIINALSKIGIKANGTGRNDVEVDGKKVSGAAFRKTKNNSIHHGTMLMNVDMKKLSKVLTVDVSKLKAKGVDSVRSRVINLKEIVSSIDHDQFCNAMIDSFQNANGKCIIEYTDFNKMMNDPKVYQRYKQLSSETWLFGKSSNAEVTFSKRFPFGLFDVIINVKGAELPECDVHSDCLENEIVEIFEDYVNDYFKTKGNDGKFLQENMKKLKLQSSVDTFHTLLKWITPHLNEIKY